MNDQMTDDELRVAGLARMDAARAASRTVLGHMPGPTHTNDPHTSKTSANDPSSRVRWGSQRYRVLERFYLDGPLTAEEAGVGLDLGYYNDRRRASELKLHGLLSPTGETRMNDSGKAAEVYAITESGRKALGF